MCVMAFLWSQVTGHCCRASRTPTMPTPVVKKSGPASQAGEHRQAGTGAALQESLCGQALPLDRAGMLKTGMGAAHQEGSCRQALPPGRAGVLKTLGANTDAPLPVRLFEVSDVVLLAPDAEVGARNERRLAAAVCGREGTFEVVHGLLNRLMDALGVPLLGAPPRRPAKAPARATHPACISGELTGRGGGKLSAFESPHLLSCACTIRLRRKRPGSARRKQPGSARLRQVRRTAACLKHTIESTHSRMECLPAVTALRAPAARCAARMTVRLLCAWQATLARTNVSGRRTPGSKRASAAGTSGGPPATLPSSPAGKRRCSSRAGCAALAQQV